MPDQGVMTRKQLVELIAYSKKELNEAYDNVDFLKVEIDKLEEKLYNMGQSLNNPRACMNPIVFSQKKCEECGFYGRCMFVGKEDYGRFRL